MHAEAPSIPQSRRSGHHKEKSKASSISSSSFLSLPVIESVSGNFCGETSRWLDHSCSSGSDVMAAETDRTASRLWRRAVREVRMT